MEGTSQEEKVIEAETTVDQYLSQDENKEKKHKSHYQPKHHEHIDEHNKLWDKLNDAMRNVQDKLESTSRELEKMLQVEENASMDLESSSHGKKKKNRTFEFCKVYCHPGSLTEDLGSNKESGWRVLMISFLENKWTHLFLMILLVIDIILVGSEFVISSLKCNETEKALEDFVFNNATLNLEHPLEEDDTLHRGVHWASLSILIVFMAHLVLLIIAVGYRFFFHLTYVFDLVVITIAIIMELAYETDLSSLLIVTTFWRVIRIAHGIYVVSEDSFETKAANMKRLLEELKKRHLAALEDLKKSENLLIETQKENLSYKMQYDNNDF